MANRDKSLLSLNKSEYLKAIARETARMSYPGRTSGSILRNKKRNKVKDAIEDFFVSKFPIEILWGGDEKAKGDGYERWHKQQVESLSKVIKEFEKSNSNNTYFAISAKLLDTFMHQLMKYEKFRYLYKELHLPLDNQAFFNLAVKLNEIEEKPQMCGLRGLVNKYKNKAFTINSDDYYEIQKKLDGLESCFKETLKEEGVMLKSRVDLNCILWPIESKSNKNHKKRK